MTACYHCGLPAEQRFSTVIDGEMRAFCCPGCQAVAGAISQSGLSDFYQFRDKKNNKGSQVRQEFAHYDLADVQQEIVYALGDDHCEILLSISGISCAACAWLIEHRLEKIPGVIKVRVNATNALCRVEWSKTTCQLSQIFSAIAEIGYEPMPHVESQQQAEREKQRKRMLMGLGLAGIGMMQVGMFGIALHAGAIQGMAHDWQHFFRWVSLLVATPVVFFSARPFFSNAIKSLSSKRLGMDVPVALAIGLAYVASVWATVTNTGEVYFDSISMFTFFLLLGRFLEMKVRHSRAYLTENYTQMLPLAVSRRNEREQTAELIPISAMQVGDHIAVAAGQTIPCDGTVVEGEGSVNEMLLTGESEPQTKRVDSTVLAGSIVGENPLIVAVAAKGRDTKIASIERLVNSAATEKPQKVIMADNLAGAFVLCVVLISGLSGLAWYVIDPAKSFWVALSVLVVTCPCALSLATPAALTAATLRLRNMGVIVTSPVFIEKMVDISHVVFDKTGTLTEGQLSVSQVKLLQDEDEQYVLSIIAAMEENSSHPIACAFKHIRSAVRADNIKVHSGLGIEGDVGQQHYRFGTSQFACTASPIPYPGEGLWQLLSRNGEALAWVLLNDQPRKHIKACLSAFYRHKIPCEILSGDRLQNVETFAKTHGFTAYTAAALPETKLQRIQHLQGNGDAVLMVGDGINDAPSLGGSHVAIAMGDATTLAKTNADAVLLSGNLSVLPHLVDFAHDTRHVIRQNFGWALLYNALALPAAVMGLIPPYLAAIGMSCSSLVVVLNGLRLGRKAMNNTPDANLATAALTSVITSHSR